MNIHIKATHVELSPDIKKAINEKIGELKRFIASGGSDTEAHVDVGRSTFHHQHGEIFFAKVDLRIPGRTIHAEAESVDIISALTEVKDQLQIEVKKFKEKGFSRRLKVWRLFKRSKNQS